MDENISSDWTSVSSWCWVDTHTHFDMPEFDFERLSLAMQAYRQGVRHLLLIGYVARYFERMVNVWQELNAPESGHLPQNLPQAHLAFGLHPCYVKEHDMDDLDRLECALQRHQTLAIAEIGLDTFEGEMKKPTNFAKQQLFFDSQLLLAKQYDLPVVLHIRKAHAEVLRQLKAVHFDGGGIAHSFSGGVQEAKALVALGFKIGITGQITNLNAKKLRTTVCQLVKAVGLTSIVIETDCPDFTPLPCHASHGRRNSPDTLPYVAHELAHLLDVSMDTLAEHLWQNSMDALRLLSV